MNIALFNDSRILRNFKITSVIAGLTLMSFVPPAVAADPKPTAAEITKARAECNAEKRKVQSMETANADDPQLTTARQSWAHTCGHAQDLISAASGIAPPAPAPDPNAAAQ